MTERRSHLLLVGLIVAALVAAAMLAVPGSPFHKGATLGLDLQGGTEVVLKAVPPKGEQVTSDGMDTAQSVMRRRVDKLGVTEPEIRKQGNDQMVIELAGVNPGRAQEVIGKTAKLELYDLQGDLLPPTADAQGNPTPLTSLYRTLLPRPGPGHGEGLVRDVSVRARQEQEGQDDRSQGRRRPGDVARRRSSTRSTSRSTAITASSPRATSSSTCRRTWRSSPATSASAPTSGVPKSTYYYLFKYDPRNKDKPVPEMSGEDLNLKGTKQDFGTQGADNGKPLVLMDFTDKGADKFHDVTSTLASRGRVRWTQAGSPSGQEDNYAQQFAIVLDRQIKSAPTVSFRDNPNGIPGNNGAEITGIGGIQEAKDLALVLQTGALPYNFRQLEKTEISATLGKDSLAGGEEGCDRRPARGRALPADLLPLPRPRRRDRPRHLRGLALRGAAPLQRDADPAGFAGLILTIGVAADANVVIFERIKEEVRAGKSVRAAISAGYAKGFHTIIDANVVTAITALVLFLVATAGVKGFALMLLIGTAISLVTAVFATRAMLGLLAGFRWFENPRVHGREGPAARALAADRLHGEALPLVRDLGRDRRDRGRLAGGARAELRHRLQGRLADHVLDADAAAGGRACAPMRSRSTRSSRRRSSRAAARPPTGSTASFQMRTKTLSPSDGQQLSAGLKSKLQATQLRGEERLRELR